MGGQSGRGGPGGSVAPGPDGDRGKRLAPTAPSPGQGPAAWSSRRRPERRASGGAGPRPGGPGTARPGSVLGAAAGCAAAARPRAASPGGGSDTRSRQPRNPGEVGRGGQGLGAGHGPGNGGSLQHALGARIGRVDPACSRSRSSSSGGLEAAALGASPAGGGHPGARRNFAASNESQGTIGPCAGK